MAEVPLAVAAANVVQQAQHERLVRVQPDGCGDLLRTVGGGAAVVAPGTGVVRLGLRQ